MQHILVINAGSSSVKFSVFGAQENVLTKIISARAARLFHQDANLSITDKNGIGMIDKNLSDVSVNPPSHQDAIEYFLGWLSQQANINLIAVGHRIVHGGPIYAEPVQINSQVMQELESYQPLAPLHQQHNLAPINIIKNLYSDLPQVVCFDTAFHQTMPELAKCFALPEKYHQEGVRRYGFHGLSYEYIVNYMSNQENIDNKKIIIAHLGNGASMCAVNNKQSIATTMSFTPLDGLVMGTRCGDLDPGVVLHLMSHYSMSAEAISTMLYKQSGLLAISKHTNNMRKLLESKAHASMQAVDLFCYQVNKHLGALVAELGGVDQLVFTAGIGENSHVIRAKICSLAVWLGLEIDQSANEKNADTISNSNSSVEISVIPTDEALMIAKHVLQVVANS